MLVVAVALPARFPCALIRSRRSGDDDLHMWEHTREPDDLGMDNGDGDGVTHQFVYLEGTCQPLFHHSSGGRFSESLSQRWHGLLFTCARGTVTWPSLHLCTE